MWILSLILFFTIIIIITVILIYHFTCSTRRDYEYLDEIPPHLTMVKNKTLNLTFINHIDLPKHQKFLQDSAKISTNPYDYSKIIIPDRYTQTFDVRWKWPNCMPPAPSQGTCGSCWAFASVHCLAARFFTCSDPEKCVKQGDFEKALDEILKVYKIKKTTLKYLFNILDTDHTGKITKDQWMAAFKKYKDLIVKVCVTPDCSAWNNPDAGLELSPDFNLGYVAEIMTFILNEPHVTGTDSHRTILADTIIPLIMECEQGETCGASGLISPFIDVALKGITNLEDRALTVFNSWTVNGDDYIKLSDWTDYYYERPLNLSVEGQVLCCEPNCQELKNPSIPLEYKNNSACKGNTLQNAWYRLYTDGVVSNYCINYSLQGFDDYVTPTCDALYGPGGNYCAGSLPPSNWAKRDLTKLNKNSDEAGFEPSTPDIALYWDGKEIKPPKTHTLKGGESIMDWAAPVLFAFLANKPYNVKKQKSLSYEQVIMREIYKNGPVTTGMVVYPDFEIDFGGPENKGGYAWKKGDDINKLIYNHTNGNSSNSSPSSTTI